MRRPAPVNRPFHLSVEAIVSFAELALDLHFRSLRRGIAALLRAERSLAAGDQVHITPLELFAFLLASSPATTNQVVNVLRRSVSARDSGQPSAVLVDEHHGVELVMQHRTITAVRRLKPRRK